MDNMAQAFGNKDRLQPYLSPAAAWALAVGTSVGWGSLVVTSNTYLALKKLGCAYVQGYYFSRPVPTEEFDRFFAERSENR